MEETGGQIEPKGPTADESRVDKLTKELAEAINETQPDFKPGMRDYAIEGLREAVEEPPPEAERVAMAAAGKPAPLNPLALGIPLVAVGFFLMLIFPPVGVLIMALGAIAVIIGLVAAMTRTLVAKISSNKAS